jgi:hypothetical protein
VPSLRAGVNLIPMAAGSPSKHYDQEQFFVSRLSAQMNNLVERELLAGDRLLTVM